ncbi:hypothetical protein DEQ92_22645, partial [Haloferax sp. Atlit-6N]
YLLGSGRHSRLPDLGYRLLDDATHLQTTECRESIDERIANATQILLVGPLPGFVAGILLLHSINQILAHILLLIGKPLTALSFRQIVLLFEFVLYLTLD